MGKMKRFLSWVVVLSILLGYAPTQVFAGETVLMTEADARTGEDEEKGEDSTEVFDGVELFTSEELCEFLMDPDNCGTNARLMRNIDMSGYTVAPILAYEACFDGNYHTISNLTLQNQDGMCGMFTSLSGAVFDLTVKDAKIDLLTESSDRLNVGLIAGFLKDSAVVENCTLSGNIRVQGESRDAYVGSVAGRGQAALVDCTSTVDMEVSLPKNLMLGGMVGILNAGYVENVAYDGNIKAKQNSSDIGSFTVSGIVGDGSSGSGKNRFEFDVYLTGCETQGQITVDTDAAGISACGILNGESCVNKMNINTGTNSGNTYVSGISYCSNSENRGNLTGYCIGDNGGLISICGASNAIYRNVNHGTLFAKSISKTASSYISAEGIFGHSKDVTVGCINYGEIKTKTQGVSGWAIGVDNCRDSENWGNVYSENSGTDSGTTNAAGIANCANSTNHGGVQAYSSGETDALAYGSFKGKHTKNNGMVRTETRGEASAFGTLGSYNENSEIVKATAVGSKKASAFGVSGEKSKNSASVTAESYDGSAIALGCSKDSNSVSVGVVSAITRHQPKNGRRYLFSVHSEMSTTTVAKAAGLTVSSSDGLKRKIWYASAVNCDCGITPGFYYVNYDESGKETSWPFKAGCTCYEQVAWTQSTSFSDYSIGEDEEAPEDSSKIYLTFWDQYDGSSVSLMISSMQRAYGSFSWGKRSSVGGKMMDRTNYEQFYMKVEYVCETHEGGAEALILAPDGFSFQADRMVTQTTVSFEEEMPGGKNSKVIPVYPIYSLEEYKDDIISFEILAKKNGKEIVSYSSGISVKKKRTEGEVTMRNSFSPNDGSIWKYHIKVSQDRLFNDFSNKSYAYSHDIAKLSAALSTAAYKADTIVDTLANLGFSCVETYLYNPSNDQVVLDPKRVAFAFAQKKLIREGQVYRLVVIVVRGTVEREWEGNFIIQDGTDNNYHSNFKYASEYVMKQFKDYSARITSQTASAPMMMLVTGHSRGAAVADLVTVGLDDWNEDHCPSNARYTYTFATPNHVKPHTANQNEDNIYNILNNWDVVTQVPGGYVKFGTNLHLNTPVFSTKMESKCRAVLLDLIDESTYDEFYSVRRYWGALPRIIGYSGNMNYFLTHANVLAANFALGKFQPPPSKYICSNHSMEYYIAWLYTGNPDEIYRNPSAVRTLSIRCPVDVEVYDSSKSQIAEIKGNQVITSQNLNCAVNGNDKIFEVMDGDNHFAIRGYDNGTMDVTLTEYDPNHQKQQVVYYRDIPVEKDQYVDLYLYESSGKSASYRMVSRKTNEVILPTQVSQEEDLEKYSLSLEVEGEGYVSGDGMYAPGEVAYLNAEAKDGNRFIGWYDEEGQMLSDQNCYPVPVEKDVRYSARFEEWKEIAGGSYGTVSWILAEDGTLIIGGEEETDSLPDTDIDHLPEWAATYKDQIRSIVLLDGIQGIGANVFCGLPSLEKVILKTENGIYVNGSAFKNCGNLEIITAEGKGKIMYVGESAFEGCRSLTTVPLDEFVTVSGRAFMGCFLLAQVEGSICYVGKEAFKNCRSLGTITLASSTQVGDSAFENCTSLKKIVGSICSAGDYVFRNSIDASDCPLDAGAKLGADVFSTVDTEEAAAPVLHVQGASVIYGEEAVLKAEASVDQEDVAYTIRYQWYDSTGKSMGTGSTLKIAPGENAGTSHYYCEAISVREDNGKSASSGKQKADLVISPRKLTITWSNYQNLEYNGSPLTVRATAENVYGNDNVGLKVTGGTASKEGTYTATASVSNRNYEIGTGQTLKYTVAAHRHSWEGWRIVSEATVQKAKTQSRTCSKCGKTETVTVGTKLKPTVKLSVSGTIRVKTGQSFTVKISGLAKGDRVVSWISSNKKIATVSSKGKVKAKNTIGKTTITVRLLSGKTAKFIVKVQKKR